MTMKNKEFLRIQKFVQHILGPKGGFPEGGELNKDGTYTLFHHTYQRLQDIINAENFDDLNQENKKAITKQTVLFNNKETI